MDAKKSSKTGKIHNLSQVVTKANKRGELAKNRLTDLIQEFPKLSVRKVSSAVRLSFGCCVRSFFERRFTFKTIPKAWISSNMLKRSKFGKKFIDKKKCTPRSPDLNTCDFFLWGYLKQRAFKIWRIISYNLSNR